MADSNQKLFSQIADLGRNINSLAESIKKNTSATESLISATDKSVKSEKESATASNKAATANPKEVKETNKDASGIKDLTKMLSGLFGEKGPLMGKIAEVAKSKVLPASGADKQPNEQHKDFSSIAGGLKGIIKAFQEGGVAKKEGKYLVGENGPEVVKLPKGAGVIPLDVKDLIAGLKTVPELADLIKDKDTIDFYGSISNTSVVDSKGKVISLNRLSADYERKGDNAKDEETANRMTNSQDIIDSLIDYGRNNITNEVNKIDGETMDLATKSKLNNGDLVYKRNQLWDDILKEVTKNGDYYNSLSVSKAALLATKTVLDKGKEGAKGAGAKAEESLEGLDDKLTKESEADLKKEAADLKKSQAVVGAKEEKKEKRGLFGRKKKEKNKEGEAKEEEKGVSLEKKEPALEKKGSALLSKIGAGAESALFSAAGNATESLGIASPLAKKGIGALKSAIDKKGGLGDVFSKKAEAKTELEKKSTATPAISPNAKPALVNDIKKLTPVAKKEAAKAQEAPKEIKPTESKSASTPAPNTDTKKDNDKKSESSEPNKSGLGSDKDIQDIKNALTRMAGLLEGTLSVSVLDQPFRPDSRRV
jgi:hypothetical protein